MTPEDDPTWPVCINHLRERHWCEQMSWFMMEGKDEHLIEPGLNYCVPVFPADNLYAEVSIDRDWIIPDVCAKISLVAYKPVFAPDAGDLISLGLWNKGEGRFVMSQALAEWRMANSAEKCDANAHGFAEEIEFQRQIKEQPDARKIHDWCLAYYKMCFICYTKSITPAPSAPGTPIGVPGAGGTSTSSGTVNFTAAQFGLGPTNFTPARNQGNASDGQAQRTRNLLAMRNKNNAS